LRLETDFLAQAPEIAVSRWFNTGEPLNDMALGAIIATELAAPAISCHPHFYHYRSMS
jgi:hypothetical protein